MEATPTETVEVAWASLKRTVMLDALLDIECAEEGCRGIGGWGVFACGHKLADTNVLFNVLITPTVSLSLSTKWGPFAFSPHGDHARIAIMHVKYSIFLKRDLTSVLKSYSSQPSQTTWQQAHSIPGAKISTGTQGQLCAFPLHIRHLFGEVLKILDMLFTKKITWLT